jgi:hypothetical protein
VRKAPIAALNKRISELYGAGKFGEAIPLAEKSLEATRTQKGPDHLDTAASSSLEHPQKTCFEVVHTR